VDRSRFDALARSLGGRTSRRVAVRGLGGAGAAAALLGGRRAAAQEATPSASPEAADDAADDTAFLFVQVAESGSWAPKEGADGVFTLTLDHANGQTVYFSDRPERVMGMAPTQAFLDGLGFSPGNPPNAALVAGEEVLVVELTAPVYDAAAGTLTYDATLLPAEAAGDGLAYLSGQQADQEFPASFDSACLFIDDCPDIVGCLRMYAGGREPTNLGPIPPGINDGQCWHGSCICCRPCNGWSQQDYDNACNAYYSECDNECFVDLGL
jgi:hypothetical protein